ncbi:MAG: YafY family transcriptional regulator [Prolixibacteraceae bacterium]|nr:YafY family transcriptional regulator [Prolixibacteraceae bacterium]
MNHIERLNAILIHLQSKRIVKASEIAERFEISLRTVYRDIRALEESGVPIGAEAGVGYFLMDNYKLPPVMFTKEEASALLFGEKLVEKMSDDGMKAEFCSALFKIKAILNPEEKDRLEKLYSQISVLNYTSSNVNFNRLFLSEIQQALVSKQVLEIDYQAGYGAPATKRLVEPIGLCNYSRRWHLFAWCRLRSEYRDFRLDRIQDLRVSTENFKGKQHISMDEFIRKLNVISDKANISLIMKTDRIKLINESKYWYGFTEEEKVDDQTSRLRFANNELRGFATWMISSGSYAQVEEPPELKQILDQYISGIIENYR